MNKRFPILFGLLLLALALWLRVSTIDSIQYWTERLDNLTYDIQLRAQMFARKHPPLKTSVAIVDIDDESIKAEGSWPWSRAKVAKLVNQIQAQGAVVIAFDMTFSLEEPNIADRVYDELSLQNLMNPVVDDALKKIRPYFDQDAKLLESLKQGDTVVGIIFLLQPLVQGSLPPPQLILTTQGEKDLDFYDMSGVIGINSRFDMNTTNVGFINIFSDEDGIIRRASLLVNYKDGLYPSLALEAVRVFLLKKIQIITKTYGTDIRLEGVKLGKEIIPTDDKCQVIIPFRGQSHTFPYVSAKDVLHDKVPPGIFAGKIVFIGSTAIGLNDFKPTAIHSAFPGIEINATIADAILKNNFPHKPAWGLGAEAFLISVLGLVLVFVFPYLGARILTLLIFLIPILLIAMDNWFIRNMGIIISVFIPILLSIALAMMNIMYGFLFEARRREHLKEIFGQYVPEKHIDEMLKAKSSYGLRGESREMTVLFSDIRNFTSLSEGMPASQIKDMLSDFFTPMTEIIFKHSGTIDKYVGDLIMAFWGAPLRDRKHAEHALNAALEMQNEVARLKPILAERHWPEINIGIGINTGMMSVGDMGSKFRRNYTVLGDAVNLASRVESLTKLYGAKILVTEFTRQGQTKFVFRLLDRVRVKGKTKSVALYQLLCKQSALTEALRKEIELSEAALNLYFQQQWQQAQTAFTALNKTYPDVKLYSMYLERLAEFAQRPPPSDWDGVYTHLNK